MIVVAIIGLLAAIAIPNFLSARSRSEAATCINNLRQLDEAASEWAMETGQRTGNPINMDVDLTPYIRLNPDGKIPKCPAGGTYTFDTLGMSPVCSLSTANPPHILRN